MKINKLNYELFFVDYYEANLSPEQVVDLMDFLEQHVDLKVEFEEFSELESISLDIEFENKDGLKKAVTSSVNINADSAEDFLVASVENDLSLAEEKDLDTFISVNPFYQADLNLYKKSKLAEDSIVFEDKESLKKVVAFPLWIKHTSQVAAAAAIILFVVSLFGSSELMYSPRTRLAAAMAATDYAKGVLLQDGSLFEAAVPSINNEAISPAVKQPVNSLARSLPRSASPEKEISTSPSKSFEKNLASSTIETDENVLEEEPIVLGEVAQVTINKVEHFKTASADRDHFTLKQGVTNFLKKQVLKEDVAGLKSHIHDLELAHTIVKSLNKVFGASLNLEPAYNNDGEMTAYALESSTFELQRNIKNK